jgi:hypothetical protein
MEELDKMRTENVKRYFTQRNMNKKIHFYGLTGLQAVLLFMLMIALYLTVGNAGPAFVLILFPLIAINKKKLSEGDPNYMDTVRVKFQGSKHLQDIDRVLRKLGNKWVNA